MAQVLIRGLDEAVVATYRRRAAAHGRSLEAELREVLTTAAQSRKREALDLIAGIRAGQRPLQPGEPTVVEMIREDRDTR
jgi:plasmid stability protein